MTGRVIALNGASSSGKTSIGRALQDRLLPEVWLLLGIDTLITAMPWSLYGTADGHVINEDGTIDVGPAFVAAQQRWRAAVSALVAAGADVILDEVLLRGGAEQDEWGAVLRGVDVRWVAVRCDVDVAEGRERARGDRAIGMARQQAAIVHAGVRYDVEVDTTSQTPEACAALVVPLWRR